jgi:hypothetical protein
MRMVMGVVNMEMRVEMVMLKGLVLLAFLFLFHILLFILFLINLNLLFQLPLFLSLITSRYNSITFHYNHYNY